MNQKTEYEEPTISTKDTQYSLKKILFIWLLSAAPMALLAFVVTPLLIPIANVPPLIVYWITIIVGLAWQFILSLLVLKTDGHELKWSVVKSRTWYGRPRNPVNGRFSNWLFLWTIPFILLNALISSGIGFPDIDRITAPLYQQLPQYDLSSLAAAEYKGAWWILGLFLLTMIFNYFLGEEFLYRGILLPKMSGVFGRWDWFVNGILFGFYHLHKPHVILSTALLFGFVFAFPSRYFQSNWMAVIIHGLEGVLGLVIVLAVILGLN